MEYNFIRIAIKIIVFDCSSIWWTKYFYRIWHRLCSSDHSRSNSTQWHH